MPFQIKSASEPPDTERKVIGYFADQKGSRLVWNWTECQFKKGKWTEAWEGGDCGGNVKFWLDIPEPEALPWR